jgi:hypothetical protein
MVALVNNALLAAVRAQQRQLTSGKLTLAPWVGKGKAKIGSL